MSQPLETLSSPKTADASLSAKDSLRPLANEKISPEVELSNEESNHVM